VGGKRFADRALLCLESGATDTARPGALASNLQYLQQEQQNSPPAAYKGGLKVDQKTVASKTKQRENPVSYAGIAHRTGGQVINHGSNSEGYSLWDDSHKAWAWPFVFLPQCFPPAPCWPMTW